MHFSDRQLQVLALKLIETFSRVTDSLYPFERYWPLAGPLEAFSAHAANPV